MPTCHIAARPGIFGISVLVHLRVGTSAYRRTPADLDDAAAVTVAAQCLGGSLP